MISFTGKTKAKSKELGIIDLTNVLLSKYNDNPKIRKVGRYSVSDLYAMLHAPWLPVEKYCEGKINDFTGVMNMWQGTWKHKQIQELLDDYEKEIKIVLPVKGFEIVGMCDALGKEDGLEMKTSKKLHTTAKKWHIHQAKIYCTMFEREVFKVVQPVVSGNSLHLNILEEVHRNDAWFEKEMKLLENYHNKLLEFTKK